ncbi:MAG: hypothetical protein ABSC49_03405 [Candidatus Microgenomates bacterium]|jgi:hypothetical protein
MLVNILVVILGILIFLFIFWKRLKEDFSSGIIFQSGAAILIGLGMGWILSRMFFPNWFFWTSFLGAVIGMLLMLLKFKLKFYETLEALTLALMPILALMFFSDAVVNSSLISFLAFAAMLLMLFLSYWLDMHYRSFTWYRSGKVGFAGLSTTAIIFLIRSVLATTQVPMISFVGKSEAIVSGVMAFICFLLLFDLGRIKK